VNDPSLTLDRFYFNSQDIIALSLKEWHDTKTGPLAKFIFGCFALTRIDKSIQDPIWETAKSKQQCNDPTEQLPNQPHIEFLNTEWYLAPPDLHLQDQSVTFSSVFLPNLDDFSELGAKLRVFAYLRGSKIELL
jgi:hypothetical protein